MIEKRWDWLELAKSDVTYRRESFILVKGRKPAAELRPVTAGRTLGELESILRSLPSLTAAEAADFAADMDATRAELPTGDR